MHGAAYLWEPLTDNIHISINGRMDKSWYIHTIECYAERKKTTSINNYIDKSHKCSVELKTPTHKKVYCMISS